MNEVVVIDESTGEIITLDHLAEEANELYDLAESAKEATVEYAWKCGDKLIEAKGMMKHGEFRPWLAGNFKGKRQTAQDYMKIAKNQRAGLLPEADSIRQALRLLAGGKGAAEHITSSESVEWYTPAIYLDATREVMGSIDLDPASNPAANEVVQATTFYTAEDDGLSKEWAGNVWLNPPYGSACAAFVQRLCDEYKAGAVKQAIILVNSNSNDTSWFRPLWDQVLCFSYGRVNFYGPQGQESGPTHGSCFVYFGPNEIEFGQVFSEFGAVVVRA